MFKKRARNSNIRKRSETEDNPAAEEPAQSGEDDDSTAQLQELLLVRKLAKQNAGIDLLRLNKGEEKKKKRPAKEKGEGGEEGDPEEAYGLKQSKSGTGGQGDDGEGDEDDASKARRLVRSSNFTQQTNALDVDKHMMAYIETELAKRRGQSGVDSSDKADEDKPFDPQAELFQIAEKYRIEKKRTVDEEEGNVTTSLGMLTSIPEVDLGMDIRLKNIEETEKAKRAMMEERQNGGKKRMDEADESFAAARFYRPHHTVQTDTEALEDAKREVQGLPPINRRGPAKNRAELATDDQVYERFKKRVRKN